MSARDEVLQLVVGNLKKRRKRTSHFILRKGLVNVIALLDEALLDCGAARTFVEQRDG